MKHPRGWKLVTAWAAVLALFLVAFTLLSVAPRFSRILEEMLGGTALPVLTRGILQLSRLASASFLLWVLPALGLVAFLLAGPGKVVRPVSLAILGFALLFGVLFVFGVFVPFLRITSAIMEVAG